MMITLYCSYFGKLQAMDRYPATCYFPCRFFSCTMVLSHKERQDPNLPQPILSFPVHRDDLYIYTLPMIQVYSDSFKLSQAYYDDIVFSLPISQMECPCGESGSLILYGSYRRKVKSCGSMLVLRIQRVRCRKCGKTHAILLSSLVPCSQISLQDQQRIIYCAYTSGRCSDVMEQNPLVDENNVKHILRQFRRYWKERILSLCLLVADELVLPCFSRFSMQFMQVRHIPNVLFHLPT